jgi:pimeloyl-ACP methyl ester carboxylesterase
MAPRAEFLEFPVDGATLGALRWSGLLGAPTVVAVHGVSANAWAWDPIAHHLAGAADLVALDLRGRGRSYGQPGPYGIDRHAADVVSIIEQLGGPVVIVGHSMGAAVAQMAAEQRPALVRDLLLIDGGPPPSADGDRDAQFLQVFGADLERLSTIWPDRVSYHAMWAGHPAFADGISPDLERNLLADLVDVDGGFRIAVDDAAVRADGTDLLTDARVRTLLDRRPPTTIIRAEFGPSGGPPANITDDVRANYPQHRWIDAPGLNTFTLLHSATGAALVATTLRNMLLD